MGVVAVSDCLSLQPAELGREREPSPVPPALGTSSPWAQMPPPGLCLLRQTRVFRTEPGLSGADPAGPYKFKIALRMWILSNQW